MKTTSDLKLEFGIKKIPTGWILKSGDPARLADRYSREVVIFERVIAPEVPEISAHKTGNALPNSATMINPHSQSSATNNGNANIVTTAAVRTDLTAPTGAALSDTTVLALAESRPSDPEERDDQAMLELGRLLNQIMITRQGDKVVPESDHVSISPIKIFFFFDSQNPSDPILSERLSTLLGKSNFMVPGGRDFLQKKIFSYRGQEDSFNFKEYFSVHKFFFCYRVEEMSFFLANALFEYFVKQGILSNEAATFFKTLCGHRLPTEMELRIKKLIENHCYDIVIKVTKENNDKMNQEKIAKYKSENISKAYWTLSELAFEVGMQLLPVSPYHSFIAFSCTQEGELRYYFIKAIDEYVRAGNRDLESLSQALGDEFDNHVFFVTRLASKLISLQSHANFLSRDAREYVWIILELLEKYTGCDLKNSTDSVFHAERWLGTARDKAMSFNSFLSLLESLAFSYLKQVPSFIMECIWQLSDKLHELNKINPEASPIAITTIATTGTIVPASPMLKKEAETDPKKPISTINSKNLKELLEPLGWICTGDWSEFISNPHKKLEILLQKISKQEGKKNETDKISISHIKISYEPLYSLERDSGLLNASESNLKSNRKIVGHTMAIGLGFVPDQASDKNFIFQRLGKIVEEINSRYFNIPDRESYVFEYENVTSEEGKEKVYYASYFIGLMRETTFHDFLACVTLLGYVPMEVIEIIKPHCTYRKLSEFETKTQAEIHALLRQAEKETDVKKRSEIYDRTIELAKAIHEKAKDEFALLLKRRKFAPPSAEKSVLDIIDDSEAGIELAKELIPLSKEHAIRAFELLKEGSLYYSKAQDELSELYFVMAQNDTISVAERKVLCKKAASCLILDIEDLDTIDLTSRYELLYQIIEIYAGYSCIGSEGRLFDEAFKNREKVTDIRHYILEHLAQKLREKNLPKLSSVVKPITPAYEACLTRPAATTAVATTAAQAPSAARATTSAAARSLEEDDDNEGVSQNTVFKYSK